MAKPDAESIQRFRAWRDWILAAAHEAGIPLTVLADSKVPYDTVRNWFSRKQDGTPTAAQAADLAAAVGLSQFESLAMLAGVAAPHIADYARSRALEQQVAALQRQLAGTEHTTGPLANLADVALRHGYAVSFWPAHERATSPKPGDGYRVADRIQIVPASAAARESLRRKVAASLDAREQKAAFGTSAWRDAFVPVQPEDAGESGSLRARISAAIGEELERNEEIRTALRAANCERITTEERVQFPIARGYPAARYAVNRFARDREPDHGRLPLALRNDGLSEQVLVLSTTVRSWPSDTAAYIARRLGWGLYTTRSAALRLYDYPMASEPRRGKERDRRRDRILAQILESEWTFMNARVVAHHGFTPARSDSAQVTVQNHAFLRARKDATRQRWPYVVLLYENDEMLAKQARRAPYLVLDQLKQMRELLKSEVQSMGVGGLVISVDDRPAKDGQSNESHREDLWRRTVDNAEHVLRRLEKYAPEGLDHASYPPINDLVGHAATRRTKPRTAGGRAAR